MEPSTQNNSSFNPIQFLGISGLNKEEENLLAKQLDEKISEYILIKLLQELPNSVDDQLIKGKIQTIEDLKFLFQAHLPNLDDKITEYLIEFRQKYNNDR